VPRRLAILTLATLLSVVLCSGSAVASDESLMRRVTEANSPKAAR